jgi:hypothetical protein
MTRASAILVTPQPYHRARPDRGAWCTLAAMRTAVTAAIALVIAACGDDLPASAVVVHAPAAPPPGVRLAIDDLVSDLGAITGEIVTTSTRPPARCVRGELHVIIEAPPGGERTGADGELARQQYQIREERCGDGHRVVVRGGGVLSTQWAIYDFLERLGVRYFHPEQTYLPPAPRWPDAPLAVDEAPAVRHRSLQAHRTHPIELSPPLSGAARLEMGARQRRWIDWNVKLRQTDVNGWDERWAGDHAWTRGFPRGAGFNLLNTQQGYDPILDPDDPRPEEVQLAEAIDARMADRDGAPPVTSFSFQFNPSEFTVAPEDDTVRRLTFITDYISERWPGVEIWTINHGTHQEPGPVHGIRFFDLPELAPPELGVKVHPLMFYGLDRAAPVYGNASFEHFRTWIEAQQAVRRITWYPESSWWLTFDLPVPLYLAPVTLEARSRDLEILRPWLAADDDQPAGVHGHHLFTSGQEWGYWLIDYCTSRMAWDIDHDWRACLGWVTDALADGAVISRVLAEVAARQASDLRDPDVIAMLVGSDDETELAAAAGIELHPLPPAPASLLGWSDERVAELRARSLDPLIAIAADYDRWADEIEATLPRQTDAQAPWVREIRDGLRIFALRARHAGEVYATVLALRDAIAAADFAAIGRAEAGVWRAATITDEARAVVDAREADYRYPPELTIATGPNLTVYPYRVLTRVHDLYYWTRPDRQLAAMFGAGLEQVTVNQRILRDGTALEVAVLADAITSLTIAWGDGAVETELAPHTCPAQGFYAWSLDVLHAAGAITHADHAAVVARRLVFPRGSLGVTAPDGADLIDGLLPGFVVGVGSDGGGDFLVTGRIDGAAELAARGSLARSTRTGSSSVAADLPVSLGTIGAITVYGAVIAVADGAGADDRRLTITGQLATDDVVALLVGTGAFDVDGAREIVAATLGYTVATLPARLPFQLDATGYETI